MFAWIAKQAKNVRRKEVVDVVPFDPPQCRNGNVKVLPESPPNIIDVWRTNNNKDENVQESETPQKLDPVFIGMNMDRRMKGQNYAKKTGKRPPQSQDKENVRVYFSRDVSPIGSPRTVMSRSSTVPQSINPSPRQYRKASSLKAYKRKKGAAPPPPNNTSASSSVALVRKKKIAPPPPSSSSTPRLIPQSPSISSNIQRSSTPSRTPSSTSSATPIHHSRSPSVEPPVDYQDSVEEVRPMDIDEPIRSSPIRDLMSIPPPIVVTPPSPRPARITTPPPSPRIPTPPPLAPHVTTPAPSHIQYPPPSPPPPPQSDTKQMANQNIQMHHMNRSLQDDIIQAAKQRARKGPIKVDRMKTDQELFTDELKEAFAKRMARFSRGTIKVQRRISTHIYQSRNTTHTMILRNLQRKMGTSGSGDDNVHEDSRVERPDEEWTPAQDLDDDSSDEETITAMTLTSRGGNYYDAVGNTRNRHSKVQKEKVIKLYKKKKYDKNDKPQPKYGSLYKLKKSIKHALGSVGKSNSVGKERGPLMNVFFNMEKNKDWELYHAEDYDKPPKTAVKVKRIEKRPLYAYNSKTGQLVMLPQQEKIYVTTTDLRIHKDALMNSKIEVDILCEGLSDEEKMSMNTGNSDNEEQITDEREKLNIMELKFEQVRYLNKKFREDEIPSSASTLSSGSPETENPPTETYPHKAREKTQVEKVAPDKSGEKDNPVYFSDDEKDSDVDKVEGPLADSGYSGGVSLSAFLMSNKPVKKTDTPQMSTMDISEPNSPPGDACDDNIPLSSLTSVSSPEPQKQPNEPVEAILAPDTTPITDWNTRERQKMLIMGPVGFRPINFNPDPNAPSLTLPRHQNTVNSGAERPPPPEGPVGGQTEDMQDTDQAVPPIE